VGETAGQDRTVKAKIDKAKPQQLAKPQQTKISFSRPQKNHGSLVQGGEKY